MTGKTRSYILTNRRLGDLNPLFVGEEPCAAGYSYGPTVRHYTLMHYVLRGKGTVIKKDERCEVHAGEAFLIHPDEAVTYTADAADPWHYQWVAFDGALSERFRSLPTVIRPPADILQKMIDLREDSLAEYRIAALLFELYAALFGDKPERQNYVRRVKDRIRALYMQPLRVEQIANELNLDRRYLSRIFKAHTGKTVQEYLISVRMQAAQHCLDDGFSVEQTAHLCGYDDPSNFSKLFKKRCGKSPAEWKRG